MGHRNLARLGAKTTLRDCLLIEEVRFALDSPLEGARFEPSVPRREGGFVSSRLTPDRSEAWPLRDRALIGVMTCALARIDTVVAMPMASCRRQ